MIWDVNQAEPWTAAKVFDANGEDIKFVIWMDTESGEKARRLLSKIRRGETAMPELQPVSTLPATPEQLAKVATDFVSAARIKAETENGLTVAEFGSLVIDLLHLLVSGLDQISRERVLQLSRASNAAPQAQEPTKGRPRSKEFK